MDKDVQIWIKVTENGVSNLIGCDEFINSLKNDYIVQSRKKWVPACSENNELWIEILLNSPIIDFITNAIIGGLTWDFIKSGFKRLKPFFNSLEKLIALNRNNIDIQNFKMEFDDITLIFKGINSRATAIVSQTVQQLIKELPILNSMEISGINSITLPIEEITDDGETTYKVSSFDWEYNPNLWKIEADLGCSHYIYNFTTREIME